MKCTNCGTEHHGTGLCIWCIRSRENKKPSRIRMKKKKPGFKDGEFAVQGTQEELKEKFQKLLNMEPTHPEYNSLNKEVYTLKRKLQM